jgi:hypothetical protein
MAHSVIITTPMPTLDEIGKRLGLSKAEQESIIRMVDEKGFGRRAALTRKQAPAKSRSARAGARGGVTPQRKKNARVRTAARVF